MAVVASAMQIPVSAMYLQHRLLSETHYSNSNFKKKNNEQVFYLLASLCLAAFFGCQNDNDMNASFSKEKGTISATIDSVGKVHNYLLEQMKDSEIGLCISNKTK